jgi:methylglyoxal/glyoxal reductase
MQSSSIVTTGKTVSNCTVKLANGTEMPAFGLGVWQSEDGTQVQNAVNAALNNGYRLVDTAAIYNNEVGCGVSIKNWLSEKNENRNKLFITSKLWNSDVREGNELKAIEKSLQNLNLAFLDLYLVHWPITGKIETGWNAMEKIYETGKARSVGVSNYHIPHLKKLAQSSKLVPHLNQVECHPFLQQTELRKYCADNNIAFQAWSPLMQGNFKNIPVLETIAMKHKKTASQIILRWNLQSNILTIPKSVTESRIIENSEIFDFELDASDLTAIAKLDCGKRFGPDPENFNF